jgi:hypothetical protein
MGVRQAALRTDQQQGFLQQGVADSLVVRVQQHGSQEYRQVVLLVPAVAAVTANAQAC